MTVRKRLASGHSSNSGLHESRSVRRRHVQLRVANPLASSLNMLPQLRIPAEGGTTAVFDPSRPATLDCQPSLSGHCGHGPIFIAQRSVANDPGCVKTLRLV